MSIERLHELYRHPLAPGAMMVGSSLFMLALAILSIWTGRMVWLLWLQLWLSGFFMAGGLSSLVLRWSIEAAMEQSKFRADTTSARVRFIVSS